MGAIVMIQSSGEREGGAHAVPLAAASSVSHRRDTIAEALPPRSGERGRRAELSQELARELLEQAKEWEQAAERMRTSLDLARRRRRGAWSRR